MEGYLPLSHPWVDSTDAPLYQVTFPVKSTDEQLLSYCRTVEGWAARVAHPVAWLMDLSRVEHVSAQQRAIFAKFMEAMAAFDRRFNKATAMILPNALLRGVATAIFWLYVPPFQHKTFAQCSEGRAWLCTVLAEQGLELRPDVALAGSLNVRPTVPSSRAPAQRTSLRPHHDD